MALAYGYGRASTNKQALSLDVQITQCDECYKSKIEKLGIPWGGHFADPATKGKTEFAKREAGKALMDRLQPGDHVIFAKADRAFRSFKDQIITMETLENKCVNAHFLDIGIDPLTPLGKMALRILGIFAEFERERIGQRTRDGFAEMRRQGRATSNRAPRGFQIEKRGGKKYFVHNLDELRLMRRIYQLRQERHSIADIGRAFRLHGVKSLRTGKEISCPTIFQMDWSYRSLLAAGKLPPDALPGASVSQPKTASTDSQPTP